MEYLAPKGTYRDPFTRHCWKTCGSCGRCENKGSRSQCNGCSGRVDELGQKVPHIISSRRAGDPVSVFADPTLVRALLGWKANHDLRDIISSAWKWHSSSAK